MDKYSIKDSEARKTPVKIIFKTPNIGTNSKYAAQKHQKILVVVT